MRLVFPVMLILLGVVLVGFVITNPSERVSITLGGTQYDHVPLPVVLLISLTVGVAFTAVVALIEGATIRLTNRRLRREIQRLETENSFLRSQSEPGTTFAAAPLPRSGGPDLDDDHLDEPQTGALASAPVYDPGGDDPATRGD